MEQDGDTAISCRHPQRRRNPETGREYCFECVKIAARARCAERGEGWRWDGFAGGR